MVILFSIITLISLNEDMGLQEKLYDSLNKYEVLTTSIDLSHDRIFLFVNRNNRLFQLSINDEILSVMDIDLNGDLGLQNLYYSEEKNSLMFWDNGGGRIHQLDFRDNSIQRIDNSFPFNAFHGHGAWVDESLNIHLMGGYGLFQLKNLYLKYSQDAKEWMHLETTGNIPEPSYGRFYFYEPDSLFLYFQNDPESRSSLSSVVKIYALNSFKRVWTKIGSFDIKDSIDPSSDLVRDKVGSKRIDQKNGILHLESNLFYDIVNENILAIDPEAINSELSDIRIAYHSGDGDEWVVLGRNKKQDISLMVEKIRLSDVFESAEIIEKESLLRWRLALLGLLLILMLLTVGYLRNEIKKRSIQESVLKPILAVSMQDSEIILKVGKNRFRVSDPFEKRLWKFVDTKVRQGLNCFDILEFDDFVLGSLSHTSQRSKKRSSLLASVKQLTGEDLFVIRQNVMDKRYREIVVKDEMITWE